MAERQLTGMRVAILVTDDFEQVEMTEPRRALDEAGAQTVLVAPKAGHVQGMRHDEKADTFPVDRTLDQARPEDFDAVLLPGGALNADALRVVPAAQAFVRAMDRAGKPIAAICHAPWLLVSAGLVQGRTLTSYHTLQDDIRNAGGRWEDRAMVRDRNWVTSRQPNDLPAFNQAMLELFAEHCARAGMPGAAGRR
ncbi:MAG: type 1 glutamine amidotransferase [Chloroflexi bacterium]|nr:type 1 glutamine amidotransferase [Chloroflexota bacterium]